jgi:hypothetical protein
MYSDKSVNIKITKNNKNYYTERGYQVTEGNIYEIKCCDVIKSVATRIYVICENCRVEKYIKSQNYHKQTGNKDIYVCSNCSHIKIKKTNLIKYGTECPLQNKDIIEKTKKTLMDEYGVDNISKLDSIKLERKGNFDTENFKKKARKTWLEKYGFDNPSKSNYIKEKKENTLLQNYGVRNPSHSTEIFEKSQKNGKKIKEHECGLMNRGTYEKHFLDFCFENNIIVEKGPTIEYLHESNKRYYHSDFYIPSLNLICEIKSKYYYEKYISVNNSKKKYSELKYNFIFIIDKKYEFLKNKIEDFY